MDTTHHGHGARPHRRISLCLSRPRAPFLQSLDHPQYMRICVSKCSFNIHRISQYGRGHKHESGAGSAGTAKRAHNQEGWHSQENPCEHQIAHRVRRAANENLKSTTKLERPHARVVRESVGRMARRKLQTFCFNWNLLANHPGDANARS